MKPAATNAPANGPPPPVPALYPPPPQGAYAASLVVTTKDRKEELRRTLASGLGQSPPVEMIVVDDGSADGTAEMVGREFPSVRLERFENPRGYIVARNRGVALASAPVVVIIDDDATFSTPHTVAQTVAEFDSPRVGAVSIPHVHHEQRGDAPSPAAPDDGRLYVTATFVGTAQAVRRDLFIGLGGYGILFHYGEESEFCCRLLGAGYVTRVGRADRIDHWVSAKRDHSRRFIYLARNHLLYIWYNVPVPYLPLHWAGTVFKLLRYGLRTGHPWWVLGGIAKGHAAIFREWGRRRPVSRHVPPPEAARRRPVVPLAEVERRLAATPEGGLHAGRRLATNSERTF